METPDWLHWLSVKSLTLEDAVSISLNCQPSMRQETRQSTSVRWYITPHCLEDGPDRLFRVRKYFDANHELLPAQAEPGMTGERVRLMDFVRFAAALDWPIPDKLKQHFASAQALPGVEEAPPKAAQDRGRKLKRNVLIAENQFQWPTVGADLTAGNENKLSAAAKAEEHGFWWEGSALEWARPRGKLLNGASPSTASVFTLGTVHRIKS